MSTVVHIASAFTFTLNQFFTNFVAPTRLKNFCLTSHSIRNRHISSAFTFTLNRFLLILSRQRAWKSFVWFQTAFAWKVKLLSNTFAWIQNSFFGSLFCRKKQLTRILDDSWKSIVLVPHSSFVSKCKKFRQNLSDGIRVRQRVKVFRNGRKKLSSFWEQIWGSPKKLVKQQMLVLWSQKKETIIFPAKKLKLFFCFFFAPKSSFLNDNKMVLFFNSVLIWPDWEGNTKIQKTNQTKKQWLKEYKINQRFLFVHRSQTQTQI